MNPYWWKSMHFPWCGLLVLRAICKHISCILRRSYASDVLFFNIWITCYKKTGNHSRALWTVTLNHEVGRMVSNLCIAVNEHYASLRKKQQLTCFGREEARTLYDTRQTLICGKNRAWCFFSTSENKRLVWLDQDRRPADDWNWHDL